MSVAAARGQAAIPSSRVHTSKALWGQPAGAASFVPDQLLVRFRSDISPAQAASLNTQLGARELRRIERISVSVLGIVSGEPVETVVSKYRAHPSVQYAEPNYYRYLAGTVVAPRPQATPNDPFYGLQWHYDSAHINLPGAWDVTTGSSLVVVAVIDTGILSSHEDLSGVTVAGFDFFDNDSNPEDPGCPTASELSHGTHVAGTVAAATNNGLGVAGVNWGGPGKTRVMPLRIFGNIGGLCTSTSDRIVNAITYAADHSARVINMSFGSSGFSMAEQDAVSYAYNTGVILIAAALNSNSDCSAIYPAAYPNVVGISATDYANAQAPYSNFGSCVDLAAPGGDTSVDLNGDGYADGVLSTSGTPASPSQYWFFQGTSMAAPHVAGLAALLISKGVTGPGNILSVMQSTAVDLGAVGCDPIYGCGLINAAAAVGAPVASNPMEAFSGDLSGSTITVTSDMVAVASNGTYLATSASPGMHSMFAWQDTNGNGLIDGGDMYGTVPSVAINAASTTGGVNVSVTEVPLGSPPITPASSPAVRR